MQSIPLDALIWAFLPALAVIAILYRWRLHATDALYAMARMLTQLVAIGYVLVYIFQVDHGGIIALVVSVMLCAASWIALRPLSHATPQHYAKAFLAIAVGGLVTLGIVTQLVLNLTPWFLPRYVVPLAGMIFANSMNTVSLAAERLESERTRTTSFAAARHAAFEASMIPMINTLMAVGLVSLPGMMTGQILSGVSPLIAVKYQIVVMCMIFGSAGMSVATYLLLIRQIYETPPAPAGRTE